ncbi:MAG TPA: 50S ribosomal protein L17 [Candidatus Tectomicrobia bacterium]|jgi:large subunit ribosomal protein L17
MRHLKKGRSLGRKSSHRKALLCNLAVSILTNGRIRTTEAKAKEVRGLVDRIITWGKRGDVHARRLAARQVRSRTIVKKVFDELAPRYRDRPGGYTRIMKIGFRHGDNAPEVIMELVDHPAPEK